MAKSGANGSCDPVDNAKKEPLLRAALKVNREASNRVAGATRDPEDWITGSYPPNPNNSLNVKGLATAPPLTFAARFDADMNQGQSRTSATCPQDFRLTLEQRARSVFVPALRLELGFYARDFALERADPGFKLARPTASRDCRRSPRRLPAWAWLHPSPWELLIVGARALALVDCATTHSRPQPVPLVSRAPLGHLSARLKERIRHVRAASHDDRHRNRG